MNIKKITFFCMGPDSFLVNIMNDLRNDYEVQFYNSGQKDEYFHYIHDTDYAWYEWCDNLVAQATLGPKMTKSILRFHSYELFTQFPSKVDWEKIDKIIFVGEVVRDIACAKFRIPREKTIVIPNGIDIKSYNIPKNKKFNKKVVYVGYINYKKGPQLLVECFNQIYNYDPEFEFHIAGKHQDERINLWFQKISKELPFQIHWDGWVEDMETYLEDKDFTINTSLFESQCLSLMEGMASGIVPLVHRWIGAEGIYPEPNTFTTANECAEIVKTFTEANEKDKEILRNSYRKYISDNFSFDVQMKDIRKILKEIK